MLAPIVDWLMLKFHAQGRWRRNLMELVMQATRNSCEARKQMASKRAQFGPQQTIDENNFLLDDGSKYSRNLIDYLIDHFCDGRITPREYFRSTWFLMGAADKTSADAIAQTIYQLAINQPVQDKLRQSIQLHGLMSEYLSWVLNESLRLLPTAPLGCSRFIEHELKLPNGCTIPANTAVITPLYTIHRLPKYWGPDADQFKPERFADTSHFHPFQYIPFGTGARGCPGKEFALFEMKKLLCFLLTRYKFIGEPAEQRFSAPILMFLLKENKTTIRISKLDL